MAQAPPPADMTIRRPSRDANELRSRLTAWLAQYTEYKATYPAAPSM